MSYLLTTGAISQVHRHNYYLLNKFPNATSAFSLRKLRHDITNVVRVRRDNDNAEQDFTEKEIMDGTLTTFTGANNGYITTLYNQSGVGVGLNLTQANNASQLQLVSSGSVNLRNGRPCGVSDGNSYMFNLNSLSYPTGLSFYMTVTVTQTDFLTSTTRLWSDDRVGIQGYCNFWPRDSWRLNDGGGFETITPVTLTLNTQTLAYLNFKSSDGVYSGGTNASTISGTLSPWGGTISNGGNSTDLSILGTSNGIQLLQADFQELVTYGETKVSDSSGITADINGYYNIY